MNEKEGLSCKTIPSRCYIFKLVKEGLAGRHGYFLNNFLILKYILIIFFYFFKIIFILIYQNNLKILKTY